MEPPQRDVWKCRHRSIVSALQSSEFETDVMAHESESPPTAQERPARLESIMNARGSSGRNLTAARRLDAAMALYLSHPFQPSSVTSLDHPEPRALNASPMHSRAVWQSVRYSSPNNFSETVGKRWISPNRSSMRRSDDLYVPATASNAFSHADTASLKGFRGSLFPWEMRLAALWRAYMRSTNPRTGSRLKSCFAAASPNILFPCQYLSSPVKSM